jgi:alcohol dehydrogenase
MPGVRAFAIDRYETPVSIHDLPKPEPDENEMLVKLGAAGVNPVAWKTLVLGQDFAGTVERVGADVHDVVAGDRVFGMTRVHGAYAE